MVNPKEYLRGLRALDVKIKQLRAEVAELRWRATGLRALENNPDKVQTTAAKSSMEEAVTKYLGMVDKIAQMEMEYASLRCRIVQEIQSLTDERLMKILYMRYVNGMDFYVISDRIGYEYKWTCSLHGEALKAFGAEVLANKKEHEQTRI